MTRGRPVVLDAGPVIHLGEADATGLLSQFDEVVVPETVYEEVAAGGVPDGLGSLDYARRTVDFESDRWPGLDPGESAALALCERTNGMLLTDDLDARQKAEDAGVEVHGSLGVVLAAYSGGRLDADEARETVRGLKRDSTLYLADPLVERVIDRIESRESGE